MKVGSKELFEVVRQVVREEVKKVLPEMVQRVLAENYVRRMVSEASRGKTVSEIMVLDGPADENEIPEPQLNTDKGIYNPDSPAIKKNESVSKLMAKNNPMAFLYEDVKLNTDSPVPDVPLNAINPDFGRMAELLEATNRSASNKREMSVSAESKMRELEMRRKALDVPVGGRNSG